jgi:hypothetical protein
MSSLRLEPFNLMANTTVYARIMAANVRGWSQPSPLNAVGPIIQGPPVMMSPPVRGASTSNKQVEVNWETVNFPMNGGSSITSYVVYWDQGTNAWVELIGETSKYTLTSYTIYTNVIAGLTYKFKVKATNIWGSSEFSADMIIVAAMPPTQMLSPLTSLDSYTGGVMVNWTMPSPNGSPIVAYYVQVKTANGEWSTYSPGCDGTNS